MRKCRKYINHSQHCCPGLLIVYKKKGALQECPVTIEEIVQRFITELESQGLKYEAYFKMSLATSMRRSEACSLQWSDSRCCISGAMW